jgi:hypothetical protein
MKLGRLAGFGFMLSLIALYGCGPPAPAPQAVATPMPVVVPVPPPPPPPPPPVALIPGPAPVAVMPPPPPPVVAPPRNRMASGVHPVIHHRRWVRRYAAVYAYGPTCGSVDHPCNVSHIVVPIQ